MIQPAHQPAEGRNETTGPVISDEQTKNPYVLNIADHRSCVIGGVQQGQVMRETKDADTVADWHGSKPDLEY